ncbi:MAG: helix-turn-helix transcriptional regulator [Clostridia bacterium]|nr:helix-turn-helix transcriptional regulator [Clostridia bacterium]
MYYYKRLKDAREDAGKSQEEIAQVLGIRRQQYARYEQGIYEIPVHHLITLAKYYQVTLDYLVNLTDVK